MITLNTSRKGCFIMIKELTNENYEEIVSADKPVVAEFYSPTCVHCKRTEAGIKELDEEGTEAVFATCDITREPALAERLDVQSLPTLLFIKNGEVKNKLIGFTHKLIIAEEIKKLK
jgi:thioredoxin 1